MCGGIIVPRYSLSFGLSDSKTIDFTRIGGTNPIPVAICTSSCHCKAPDKHSPNMIRVRK